MLHAEPDTKITIAHRGASGYLPEHTLAAKALAHAMGADYLEQDVVLTKDGVPIVLHDIYLDTVTDVATKFSQRKRSDGRYYAIDFTLSEIKTLSAHERINLGSQQAVFPNRYPVESAIFRVSTLAEELEFIQGLNRSSGREVGVFPEIKAPKFHRDAGFDLSKITLDLLASYGYKTHQDLVILQCFDWVETQRIRNELAYNGKLIQLLGENNWGIAPNTNFDYLKSAEGLKEIATIANGIGPWIAQLVTGLSASGEPTVSNLVIDAKAVGLQVYPYTVRSDALPEWAESIDELLNVLFNEIGVDGVFTDFPDKTVALLRRDQITAP